MSESSSADIERLRVAVRELTEHFETVQIFVTKHDPTEIGGTAALQDGSGHWYGRIGQVREWLQMQDERVKKKVLDEDEDDE